MKSNIYDTNKNIDMSVTIIQVISTVNFDLHKKVLVGVNSLNKLSFPS